MATPDPKRTGVRAVYLATVAAAALVGATALAACGSGDPSSLLSAPGGSTGAGGVAPGFADAGPSGPPTAAELFAGLEPDLTAACASCHGDPSNLPSVPKFMTGPDRYKTIVAFAGIVVPDPQTSKLLSVGETVQHGGGPGLSNSEANNNLRDRVTTWLIAEANTIKTAPLPGTDPFTVVAGPNSVDISKGGVAGAKITFTATLTGTTLTFTSLRIVAPQATGLHVVHPVVAIVPGGNGKPVNDIGDSFSNTDQTVANGSATALGDGIFILDVASTIGRAWQPSDKLKLLFTKLETAKSETAGDGGTTTTGGCKSPATFASSAVPAIQANNCLGCHQGQNGGATGALDLSLVGTDNTAACAQALTRVDHADHAKSDIILAPTGGVAAHPFKNADPNFTAMMLSWINNE